jgi:autotransporter-associated beta strand protein
MSGSSTATNGALTKLGGGTLTLSGTNLHTGATTISAGTLSIGTIGNGGVAGPLGASTNAAANLVFDGGALQYTGSTASTDRNFTINTGRTATINVTSSSSNLTISGASTATNGALTKTGSGTLILSGANLHTGTTTVSTGKLLVDGSLTGSFVSVASGATLGGSGTFGAGATLQSGGHLAPGDSVGTITFTNGLTLASGGILDFQLGSSSDKIVVTGGSLAGPLTGLVTLNLTNAGGFAAGSYTLFDFSTGATTNSFDVADFGLGTTIAGYNYSLAISSNTLVLTASAIPEPTTCAAVFGLGALGFAAYRRRRSAA